MVVRRQRASNACTLLFQAYHTSHNTVVHELVLTNHLIYLMRGGISIRKHANDVHDELDGAPARTRNPFGFVSAL